MSAKNLFVVITMIAIIAAGSLIGPSESDVAAAVAADKADAIQMAKQQARADKRERNLQAAINAAK